MGELLRGQGPDLGRFGARFPQPERTMLHVLRMQAREKPDKPWLVFDGVEPLTFGEAQRQVNRVADAIADRHRPRRPRRPVHAQPGRVLPGLLRRDERRRRRRAAQRGRQGRAAGAGDRQVRDQGAGRPRGRAADARGARRPRRGRVARRHRRRPAAAAGARRARRPLQRLGGEPQHGRPPAARQLADGADPVHQRHHRQRQGRRLPAPLPLPLQRDRQRRPGPLRRRRADHAAAAVPRGRAAHRLQLRPARRLHRLPAAEVQRDDLLAGDRRLRRDLRDPARPAGGDPAQDHAKRRPRTSWPSSSACRSRPTARSSSAASTRGSSGRATG